MYSISTLKKKKEKKEGKESSEESYSEEEEGEKKEKEEKKKKEKTLKKKREKVRLDRCPYHIYHKDCNFKFSNCSATVFIVVFEYYFLYIF